MTRHILLETDSFKAFRYPNGEIVVSRPFPSGDRIVFYTIDELREFIVKEQEYIDMLAVVRDAASESGE